MNWNLIAAYALAVMVLLTVGVLPWVVIIRRIVVRRREREESKQKVRDAIAAITADGKVEGPKGPYVPHRRHGAMTDHATSPPKQSGRYHHPWA